MRIMDLSPDHFGKFRDEKLELKPGMNVIYGENESGKSTIHTFISSMLFGMERGRGRAAGKDTFSRLKPWNGGADYQGRMRFEYNGHIYRITRDFSEDATAFELVDESTGQPVSLKQKDISELIDGMNAANYRNSISISQLGGQLDGNYAMALQTYMANMSMTGEASVDVSDVLTYLKAERKKISGLVPQQQLAQMESQLSELGNNEGQRQQTRARVMAFSQQEKSLEERIKEKETAMNGTCVSERSERMRAIQLIQENNDITEAYRKKKAQLKQLEQSGSSRSQEDDISKDIAAYDRCHDSLVETDSRLDEINERQSGGFIRNIALVFPLVIITLVMAMLGSLFGLDGIGKIAAVTVMAAVTALVIWLLFTSAQKNRARKKALQAQADKLDDEMDDICSKYQVQNIQDLKSRVNTSQGRQENITALRQELASLKQRYKDIQIPLKPYIERFGDSITLETEASEPLKAELFALQEELAEVRRQRERLDWELEQLDDREAMRVSLEDERQQLKECADKYYQDIMAIDISENTIKELAAQIHEGFGTTLNSFISQMTGMVTDGQHDSVFLDEQFNVMVDNTRRMVPLTQLSAGTVDQIYFAVRMAVSRMVFSEVPMPLILDDSFTLYDDSRLERILTWLAQQDTFSQVIIFTCQHREADILERAGIKYNYISL